MKSLAAAGLLFLASTVSVYAQNTPSGEITGQWVSCGILADGDIYNVIYPIESSAWRRQWIQVSPMFGCRNIKPNDDVPHNVSYCIMVTSADSGAEAGFPPSDAHKMWQDGQIGSANYIPVKFYISQNNSAPWGDPDGIGADKGVGQAGYTTSYNGSNAPTGGALVNYMQTAFAAYLNIPAGTYANQFKYKIRYSIYSQFQNDAEALCHPQPGNNTVAETISNPMLIQIHARTSCNIKVNGEMNFGKRMNIKDIPIIPVGFTVNCTKGTNYSIGWGYGLHQQSDLRRGMKCDDSNSCGDSVIEYELYKDAAATQIWRMPEGGNTDLWGMDGIADGTDQPYTVYGQVFPYPSNPNPLPGRYRDTVVATVFVNGTGCVNCKSN